MSETVAGLLRTEVKSDLSHGDYRTEEISRRQATSGHTVGLRAVRPQLRQWSLVAPQRLSSDPRLTTCSAGVSSYKDVV